MKVLNLQDIVEVIEQDHKKLKKWIKRNRLCGRVYGSLTVIGRDEHLISRDGKRKRATWCCVCDCGNIVRRVLDFNLKAGNQRRCSDCSNRSSHGHTVNGPSPTYRTYSNIMTRTSCESHEGYPYYSQVPVCDRWKKSFKNFLEDMKEKPSEDYDIHRIDPDGPYSPENCEWVERSVHRQIHKELRKKKKESNTLQEVN